VIKAVLLDTEARSASAADRGKLREPLVRLSNMWRAFDVQPGSNGVYGVTVPERAFSQRPFGAPSVFNFYEPDYQPPGALQNLSLYAPEFQILDESTVVASSDALFTLIASGYNLTASTSAASFTAPLNTAYLPPSTIDNLPDANAELVEALNVRLMYGSMSSVTKGKLVALLNGPMSAASKRHKALNLIHLIMLTPEFNVQK
jgi:hypothetical protein